MKKLILSCAFLALLFANAYTQGCVVMRNISGFGQYNLTEKSFSTSVWHININNRFFKSYHDYRGKNDINTPKQNESIIRSYTMGIDVTRMLINGWSINFGLPFAVNSREANGEHGGFGTTRYTTRSAGLGDIRFTVYKWLLAPSIRQKGNIQLGLGLKFATGDYQFKDYFHTNTGAIILAPVNPSIQLGDGGTGIVTELNTFYLLGDKFSLYGNFYYLVSPRNQNGVVAGWKTPTDTAMMVRGAELSVPDNYSIRVGANLNIKKWGFSLGLRDEGAPVHDLVGGSDGIRRPGYVFSVEPGVLFNMKKSTVYAYVPIIAARKISLNVPDERLSKLRGTPPVIGPGGSGDYQVFLGVQFRL